MAAYTTIDDPEAYFQVKTYSGTGSENAITLDGDTDMQPDLVWIKERNNAISHRVFDSVRGATKRMFSNNTDAESTEAQSLKSFDSDGFTLGTGGSINGGSDTYVSWNWKESATAGFDIVGSTGNNTARTISHSLSAVPAMIIHKDRTVAQNWLMTHKGLAQMSAALHVLNDTEATGTSSGAFNNTAPTSSVFSVGANAETNADGSEYIYYLWSEKQGFSKFGSYTGNGVAGTGSTFVYTGFRPAWLMIKNTADTHSWSITDNRRSGYNENATFLYADTNGTDAAYPMTSFYSNGFQPIEAGADKGATNDSGVKYIYIAFAEAPFVNSEGVPNNAR